MTETKPTLERFVELYESDRDEEAFALAGEAYFNAPEEYHKILQWYVSVPLHSEVDA